MDKETMRQTLTILVNRIEKIGGDLHRSITELNTHYADIKCAEKDRVRLFTDDYYTFLDNWDEISEYLRTLLIAAKNVNENLLDVLEPQNDSNNSDVQIIVETVGANTSETKYFGRIEGDDCNLKFVVITDQSKVNTEEGLVKAIRIFDSDSRDLLNYQKPGTFKVIPDNNGDLVEYYIKLLRKFDTNIPSEG